MTKTTPVQATIQEQTTSRRTSGNQSINWKMTAQEASQLMQLLNDGKELTL